MLASCSLAERARTLGDEARERLARGLARATAVAEVRGRGLMLGVECRRPETSLEAVGELLARGYVALPSGAGGRVVSLTPPLTIDRDVLLSACDAIIAILAEPCA